MCQHSQFTIWISCYDIKLSISCCRAQACQSTLSGSPDAWQHSVLTRRLSTLPLCSFFWCSSWCKAFNDSCLQCMQEFNWLFLNNFYNKPIFYILQIKETGIGWDKIVFSPVTSFKMCMWLPFQDPESSIVKTALETAVLKRVYTHGHRPTSPPAWTAMSSRHVLPSRQSFSV